VGDPLDLKGVGHHAASDERGQEVVDVPGVAGGLQDDGVVWAQMGGSPSREVIEGDAARLEHYLLVHIHDRYDNEVLVEVKPHKAR
jgi:hypothetical protein